MTHDLTSGKPMARIIQFTIPVLLGLCCSRFIRSWILRSSAMRWALWRSAAWARRRR